MSSANHPFEQWSRLVGGPWNEGPVPWRRGVLAGEQLRTLVTNGYIKNMRENEIELCEASLDLQISDEAYELKDGSIKPFQGESYRSQTLSTTGHEQILPQDGYFFLKREKTYVFRAVQSLDVAKLFGAPIYGQATAKSTVGRVDALVRLILDGCGTYEYFDPTVFRRSNGEFFIEVTPFSFDLRIPKGSKLNQLRLFIGSPSECEIKGDEFWRYTILHADRRYPAKPRLSLNLSAISTPLGKTSVVASAFRAINEGEPEPIRLSTGANDPEKFFRPVRAAYSNEGERADINPAVNKCSIQVQNGGFYIMRSLERLCLPPTVAVYVRATNETLGELRIHYAGFVHPWFGWQPIKDSGDPGDQADGEQARRGTPLIFEVRGYGGTVKLRHGEVVAKLEFYEMSQATEKPEPTDDDYTFQELKLSKVFRGK